MTLDPLSFLDDDLPVKPEYQPEVERAVRALESAAPAADIPAGRHQTRQARTRGHHMTAEPPGTCFISIGRNGPDGAGYTVVSWGVSDADASAMVTELTGRIGEPDVESAADEQGLLEIGRAHQAHAVVSYREQP